jgi:4-aminobutyrate aminotransferase-like enzyme
MEPLLAAAESLVERCARYEGGGLRTFADPEPLVLERAEGSHLYDADGRRYLDLSGLYAVANIGHGHPAVVQAVMRQAKDLMHCPSASPSRVRAEFYEALAGIAPPELRTFLPAITGAMANEIAVRIALTRRPGGRIVSFSGSYFGRSVGVVGLAGKTAYRESLGVGAQAQFLPYPYPARMGPRAAETVLETLDLLAAPGGGLGEVAAVIAEPVQGNGGVVVPPAGFLPGLRRFCDRTGALLILDEIQSGCGRSGRMWAIEHSGVVPDLMTVGKGLGGGMAVAAVLGRREVMRWPPDAYSSTFLTNNLNLAAAVAAIGVLRQGDLAERSRVLGAQQLDRLRQQLAGSEGVIEVRGLGLWIAIELGRGGTPDPALARRVLKDLRARGIVAGGGGYEGHVVKIQPPLTIAEADLADGIDGVVAAVRQAAGGDPR